MVTATLLLVATAFSAWAAANSTITFVRHGESEGNVSCCIDTKIPGPDLTANGVSQADAIATALAGDGVHYTSIYDSDMVRTQQTAAPFATATGLTPTTLNGLHEVQAGILEGTPQKSGIARIFYALIPLAWSFGLYAVPMVGSPDLTGANFQSRFNGAVNTMYTDGGANPVAFAHGMSIMAWTLMNVKNPDWSLMLKHPLSNTDTVSVTGNPTDGWTLVSWGGKAVTQNPALLTKLLVNVRDLIATPQMAVYNVTQALRTLNISTIAKAIAGGVFDTVKAAVNFPINVVKSVVNSIQTGTLFKAAAPPADAIVPPSGSTLGTAGSPIGATAVAAASAAPATKTVSPKAAAAVTSLKKKPATAAAVAAAPEVTPTSETTSSDAKASDDSTSAAKTPDAKTEKKSTKRDGSKKTAKKNDKSTAKAGAK